MGCRGARLPGIVMPWSSVGTLAPYWQVRFGFPAASVIAWTGDNPSTLIGAGLVEEGRIAISLGTSDTVFGPMSSPRMPQAASRRAGGLRSHDCEYSRNRFIMVNRNERFVSFSYRFALVRFQSASIARAVA